ncbi:hypothetical protein GCM10018965_031840 [Nonomuraea roseola]
MLMDPLESKPIWTFIDLSSGYGGVTGTLEPLPKQGLNEEETKRLPQLGKNGPRDVAGLTMTHCVPNGRA